MLQKMKALYCNLRIKHKMFLLISFVLLVFSTGALALLQYAFNVYNAEIYRQSAQSLSVSSSSIENELRKMERLSYRIATDQYVQSYLLRLRDSETKYERYSVGMDLRRRLLEIGALDKYVRSIQVYDVHGKEYATGNKVVTLSRDRWQQIKEASAAEQGGVKWIFPDETDSAFVAARSVRSYLDASLDHIGTIAVRIDFEAIVANFSSTFNEEGARLVIFDEGERRVYPVDESLSAGHMPRMGHKGYALIKDEGKRYFTTYHPADHTKWTYMVVTPYDSLFTAIMSVRKVVLATFATLFLLVMFVGMRFAGGLTGPIESLNRKMKQVETGDFEYSDEEDDVPFSGDETGQMHHNFNHMMQRINRLIEENYKKQLVIKDAEYKTLQAQVNPHFLYNTLESINWAAKVAGHEKISSMAESLGYILHSSMSMKELLIPLQQELKIVENYITIQKYRFEDRLLFYNQVPDSMLHFQVPKFSLQPLVENAIRHGLERMVGTCTIAIFAKIENERLVMTVKDNGPGIEQPLLRQLTAGQYKSKGTGIGLNNIHERIQIVFGEPYGIEVVSEKYKGTEVRVVLPCEGGKSHDVQGFARRR